MEQRRKQVLSGIQPTGKLHFGRYFGAIRNWVDIQSEYDCVYSVVDYHALTMPLDYKKLRNSSWELALNLIACGVKVENLFIQSMVPEHVELSWIFNCMTGFGELGRMTQFKDKSQVSKEKSGDQFISSGLYVYPVLQAADILIYRADYVPVGKDQEQHLELSRNIAQRFNHNVGKEYFVLPEPLFTETPKIMSTADPEKKMSASLGEKHNIDIFADPEQIRKQIRSAVTDTGSEEAGTMSPGIANLFMLLKASGDHEAHRSLLEDFKAGAMKYVDLKDATGNALVASTEEIRERQKEIQANKKEYKNRIKESAGEIRKKAQETMREVKELVGLINAQ